MTTRTLRLLAQTGWGAPLLIVVVALCVRLLAIWALSSTVYWDNLLWDEEYYHQWAMDIAEGGDQFSDIYKAAPAPAYLFAAVYKIAGPSPHGIRALSLLAGVFLCFLVYATAVRLFDKRTAFLAGITAAFCGPLLLFSAVPLKAIWSALLLVAIAWGAIVVWETPAWPRLALLGALCAFASVTRPNAMVLVPVAAVIIVAARLSSKRRIVHAASGLAPFAIGCALVLAPFVIRNYAVSGEPVLATSQAGFNFHIANDPDDPYPFFRPKAHASGSPFEEGIQFTIEASRRAGKTLTTSEASRYWIEVTLQDAAERPGAFAKRLLQKTAVLLSARETSDHYDLNFLRSLHSFFKVPWIGFAVILPLAMVGVLLSRRDPKVRAVSALAVVYGATFILFFTVDRYRAGLTAVLIPFSAHGLRSIVDRLRQRRLGSLGILVAIALVAAALQHIPYPGRNDLTAMWNGYAFFLQRTQRMDEAVAYWEKSSRARGAFSDLSDFSLAAVAAQKGELKDARRYLAQIEEGASTSALKHELLGDLAAEEGNMEKAIFEYERSTEINSGRQSPWIKLVRLYASRSREKLFEAHSRLSEVRSFY